MCARDAFTLMSFRAYVFDVLLEYRNTQEHKNITNRTDQMSTEALLDYYRPTPKTYFESIMDAYIKRLAVDIGL